MAFNGAGVRDTARTLKIGINTVIRTLKNSTPTPKRITSSPVAHADVALICELDEQWSFVGSTHVLLIGSITRITPKQGGYWPTLLVPRTDETLPGTTGTAYAIQHRHAHQRRLGAAMAGRCRRISI
ncbi:Transposase [Shigella dysenteriae 1617]|uniref:Transposase n=1 Tax=Shigella dysenteriae 1617 TaxID=754093 RepID=A0A0A6ZY00_SHIDY|nr:Transposase [Shigella dysenteriae 1617]